MFDSPDPGITKQPEHRILIEPHTVGAVSTSPSGLLFKAAGESLVLAAGYNLYQFALSRESRPQTTLHQI